MPNQSDPNNPTLVVDPVAPITPVVPSIDPTVTSPSVQQPTGVPPTFFPTEDAPPVPDFQAVTTGVPTISPVNQSTNQSATEPMGSAAPADFPQVTSSPKKRYGGGKIIATILGLFVLIGGVGAGILLTQQNQQFNQKASGGCPSHTSQDSCTGACSQPDANGDSYQCSWDSGDSSCGKTNKLCGGGGGVGRPLCVQGVNSNLSNQCTQGQASTCQKGTDGQNTGYSCTCVNAPAAGQNAADCEPWNGQCTTFDLNSCPSSNPGGNAGQCIAPNVDYQKDGGCIKYNGSGTGTIWSYECPNLTNGTACNLNGVAHAVNNGQSICLETKPASWCGSQQIDGGSGAACFVSRITQCSTSTTPPNSTPTPTPTPTAPGITAQCVNVKAYSTTWTLLTSTQLSALKAGNAVNFCVVGSASAGSFDKARFTINGVAQAETTTQRPGTQDFCQNYTIPAATTVFRITAQIHHVPLGWR